MRHDVSEHGVVIGYLGRGAWATEASEVDLPFHVAPGKRTLTDALPPMQRKARAGTDADPEAVPAASASTSATGMPAAVQAQMEAAFDFDFSAVRIHQDGAAEAAGARAFARGTDVHFAAGEYAPEDAAGQALLGHELAHVVQQADGRVGATRQAKGWSLNDDAALEAEADDHGERAARGEVVRHGGGSARGAAVMQRARNGRHPHKPHVTGYPTKDGDECGDHELPLDPECLALLLDVIIPELEGLGDEALKTDDRDDSLTGYMIGVARVGKIFVASTSGASPDAADRVLKRHCHQVVRSNVPPRIANKFVKDDDDAEMDPKLGRIKITRGNETGGAAGFCAAFKILYAHPEHEFDGMAEVLYAPRRRPSPKIADVNDDVIAYDHLDPVPSCATCQVAMPGLRQRGADHRRPRPVVAKAKASVPQGPTPEQVLAQKRGFLDDFAGRMGSIPGLLLTLHDNLPVKRKGEIGGDLLGVIKNLTEPLTTVAALVRADAAVRAEDDELVALLKEMSSATDEAHATLRLSTNDAMAAFRCKTEGVRKEFLRVVKRLETAAQALKAYVDAMMHEDEGGEDDEGEGELGGGGGGTLGDLLMDGLDEGSLKRIGPWLATAAPPKLTEIQYVSEEDGALVLTCDDGDWQLDTRTGKLARVDDDGEEGGHLEDNAGLDDDTALLVGAQASFEASTAALGVYMTIDNASDHGNNCLIYSLAGAAGIELTTARAAEIRDAVGGGDAYLQTTDVAGVAAELGIARPIVVIDAGSAAGNHFSVEHIGAGEGAPIYLVNAANIHFGWATVKPSFAIEDGDLEYDVGIVFVAHG